MYLYIYVNYTLFIIIFFFQAETEGLPTLPGYPSQCGTKPFTTKTELFWVPIFPTYNEGASRILAFSAIWVAKKKTEMMMMMMMMMKMMLLKVVVVVVVVVAAAAAAAAPALVVMTIMMDNDKC